MDIKIHGLTRPIVEEAIARTREARLYIMDEVMSKAIAEPRKEVNEWAPKIEQIQSIHQRLVMLSDRRVRQSTRLSTEPVSRSISQMMALFQFAEQIKR